jgi:hypothetical protein
MITASLVLTSSLLAPEVALPSYTLTEGDTWKFQVKAKADIQPYSIGGPLTIKFGKRPNGKWSITMNHKSELEMNGDKGPGQEAMAFFEVEPTLLGTGAGEGSLLFGQQLAACLALPGKASTKFTNFDVITEYTSKATEEKEMIKVTSSAKAQTAQYAIEQWIDKKSGKLVQAKCVTTNATGAIRYELLPSK